jgi:hypothetical protein
MTMYIRNNTITELKHTLDFDVKTITLLNLLKDHSISKMPRGAGKSMSLLFSLILSFLKMKKQHFKLVYCTRTILEIEKTITELKFVMDKRA